MIPTPAVSPSPASNLVLTTNMVSELTRHSLPVLSAADFAALSTSFIAALEPGQLGALKGAAHGDSGLHARRAPDLTTSMVVVLQSAQISAFGNSRQDTEGLVALRSAQISAFGNSRQDTEGLVALRSAQISAFGNSRQTTEGLEALRSSQISAFSSPTQNTEELVALSSAQISAFSDSAQPTLSRASVLRSSVSTLAQAINNFAETDVFTPATGQLDFAFGKNATLPLTGAINISHLTQVLQQFDQNGQLLQATGLVAVGNSANSLPGLTQRDTLGILAISK